MRHWAALTARVCGHQRSAGVGREPREDKRRARGQDRHEGEGPGKMAGASVSPPMSHWTASSANAASVTPIEAESSCVTAEKLVALLRRSAGTSA